MYDDPSRRDTDVERTFIEGAGMPPQYPPSPPQPERSGVPMWMLALGGLGVMICIAIAILGVVLSTQILASPSAATASPAASATAPQQQSSPAASITSAVTESASTPTDAPTPTLPATASPTSALPAVEVQPYCERYGGSPVYVEAGHPVTLVWYWRATSAALVQDHLDTATYTIILDGEEILAQSQSDIEYDPADPTFPYVVRWRADVGVLNPGEHSASRGLYWTREISDGVDSFGPGTEYETLYDTCTIIIE